MTTFDKLTNAQRLRAALHRDVRAISSETCHFLGLEVTKPAMEIIAELLYKKLVVYGADLEAFAKHAKRTVINSEDVKLLARRNPSLLAHLNSVALSTNPAASKRKKTGAKPQETPAKTKEDANKNKEAANKSAEDKVIEPQEAVEDRNADLDSAFELDNAMQDFENNMIVDDTIDLTFD